MKIGRVSVFAVMITSVQFGMAQSGFPAEHKPALVTPENFARAESDLYFGGVVKNGGFGKFDHTRSPAPGGLRERQRRRAAEPPGVAMPKRGRLS